MRTTHVIGGLLAAALLSSTAFAQTSTTPSTSAPPAATKADVGTPLLSGTHWRASKLIGVNIYNEQNEKLGDISEIILDKEGKVLGYVIGVGGFLGMGQHDILVEPSKIKFSNEPMRTASTSNTGNRPTGTTGNNTNTATNTAPPPATTNPPANTNANAPTNTRNASNTSASNRNDWYPDHGVLNANKDQLKAMPQFKYTNDKG